MLLIEGRRPLRRPDRAGRSTTRMLPGVSLDGETYFYQNPLADEGAPPAAGLVPHRLLPAERGPHAGLAARLLLQHLGRRDLGAPLRLRHGRHHAAGWPNLRVAAGDPLSLGWRDHLARPRRGCSGADAPCPRLGRCGERAADGQRRGRSRCRSMGGYAVVQRDWQPGDVVRLELPMPVRRVEAHPNVEENTGRVALMRGPLLYCVEQTDNPGVTLTQLTLPDDSTISANDRPDLLGGVVTLTGQANVRRPDDAWTGRLYRESGPEATPPVGAVSFTAIPYHAWANREAGPMRVWMGRG